MQIKTIIKIVSLLVFFFIQVASYAQISSDKAHYTDTTKYLNDSLGQHLIFVYSTKRGNYPPEPELTATIQGYDSLTFEWFICDETALFFSEFGQIDRDVESSTIQTSQSRGFKVHAFNDAIDTNLYCWVNITPFEISGIKIQESNCDYMELMVSQFLNFGEDYTYFDIIDSTALIQQHKIEDSRWEVEPELELIEGGIDPKFKAPVENTRFTLTIDDNFNQTRTSYLDIEEEELDEGVVYLKATKAGFNAKRAFFDQEAETDTSGQAPMNVQFENVSKNGVNFEWTFYNEKRFRLGSDSILNYSIDKEPIDSIEYTLTGLDGKEGYYDVKLISYGPIYEAIDGSDEQCKDTLLKNNPDGYIVLDSVSVPQFANVFTPPGEPNAVFHFKDFFSGNVKATSIKSFSIKIFNRWGDKVHEYEGDINEWQGWDGTTLGNSIAKTGVYYYSAFIEGWDGEDHNDKGYLHLFRDDK